MCLNVMIETYYNKPQIRISIRLSIELNSIRAGVFRAVRAWSGGFHPVQFTPLFYYLGYGHAGDA